MSLNKLSRKASSIMAIASIIGLVFYGVYYFAFYEIRLTYVEKKVNKDETLIEKIDDRLDTIYTWLRMDDYKDLSR